MQKVTLTIPEWANPFGVDQHTWWLIVSLCLAALLGSIAVEFIKRKYNAKQQENMAKHFVAILLTAFTTLFTLASYFISFAQTNASTLNALPFLGAHVPQAIGIAYLFYNLRLNKWYQGAAKFLGKWSKSGDTPATLPDAATPTGVTQTQNFVAQDNSTDSNNLLS